MMDLKYKVFDTLIKDYLKYGRPIGSKYLKKKYFPNLASSTIRWYLRKLTKDNFIVNIENYAGRIPTDKGWRTYLEKNINSNKNYSNYFKFKKIIKESDKFNYLLKKFYLYSIICYNRNIYLEEGLDYIFKNHEFNQKENILKLAQLIKKIKTNQLKINLNLDKINVFIGREINISNIDIFSIFCWQKNKNKYYLISIKRTNYPLIYNLINELFFK